MKTAIKLAIISIVSFIPLVLFGQQLSAPPDDVRQLLPDEDWLELYCLDTKVEAGLGITRLEALGELLPPLLEQAKKDLPDFKAPRFNFVPTIALLKSNMEAVCLQPTIEAAQREISNFVALGEAVKKSINSGVKEKVVSQLENQGEKLKVKLESEITALAREATKKAEDDLRLQAREEAKTIEDNLKSQAAQEESEQESRIAAGLAQQAEAEIRARAESGEFGPTPDMEQLIQLGQALAQERLPSAIEKARTDLNAKYDKLAKEAEENLNKKYEQLAQEAENRIKEQLEQDYKEKIEKEKNKLEEIVGKFRSLAREVDLSSQYKFLTEGWADFYIQAFNKKKDILGFVMAAQVNDRIKIVESYASAIDQARARGEDIPTAEELISQLRINVEAMQNRLAAGDLNPQDIRAAAMELSLQCDVIRFALERVQPRTSAEIYQSIEKKLKEFGYSREDIGTSDLWLQKGRKDLEAARAWEPLCAKSDIYESCKYIYSSMNLEKFTADLEEKANAEWDLITTLKKFLQFSEKSDADALMNYKQELITALNNYKGVNNIIAEKYPSQKYLKVYGLEELKIYSALLPREPNDAESLTLLGMAMAGYLAW